MASRTKLVVGGLATYGLAVYAGYHYSIATKKPSCCGGGIDGIGGGQMAVDPRSIKLTDRDRLESFAKHAKTYDDGKTQS
jgi:hypothetical protein